jgi:hypothetical protein
LTFPLLLAFPALIGGSASAGSGPALAGASPRLGGTRLDPMADGSWVFSYQRQIGSPLQPSAETSTDLKIWVTASPSEPPVSVGGGYEEIRVVFPAGEARRFFRLAIPSP